MEEYKFDLVIKGTLRAYSPEHAEDRIEELTDALFDDDGVYSSQKVLKIGDKISPLQTNLSFTADIRELIRADLTKIAYDILQDLEEFTVKPSIFDRTNYIEVRKLILGKIKKYKQHERWETPEGLNFINKMTDELVGEIYSCVNTQVARDIIGGIEEVKSK
jgi:hypothetical protein